MLKLKQENGDFLSQPNVESKEFVRVVSYQVQGVRLRLWLRRVISYQFSVIRV
ncbi:MAG: hypothetical protein JRJ12_16530 [Deltaproteobacteria bacterium]|nr:hypothetical protein [Deltaproteobacteria bacterium]MBW2072864.1 hypothetical protein [Deltaproteobacteria bacterium]